MEFEYDPAKDLANQAKHGLSLIFGVPVIKNSEFRQLDQKRDYGELRINAFALIDKRLHVCTYTMRGNVYRIISVRKASRQEQREWLTSK